MTTPSPLTRAEQYGYTNGGCAIFVAAAHRVVGGTPTVLRTTDPRHLEAHGWPQDEPLDLHIFLTLPDGSVVDAEGRRTLAQLKRDFGVRAGYTHEVLDNVPLSALGTPGPALVGALEQRLRELGWTAAGVPEADRGLNRRGVFAQAADAFQSWWPIWCTQIMFDGTGQAPKDNPLRRLARVQVVAIPDVVVETGSSGRPRKRVAHS